MPTRSSALVVGLALTRLMAGLRRLLPDLFAAGVSAVVSFAVMIAVQTPLLDLSYAVVPGRKSSDGPILVLVAYALCLPLAIVAYAVARRRLERSGRFVPLAVATCVGPVLMIIMAFVDAWAARLPV